jgi:hypothetical protein
VTEDLEGKVIILILLISSRNGNWGVCVSVQEVNLGEDSLIRSVNVSVESGETLESDRSSGNGLTDSRIELSIKEGLVVVADTSSGNHIYEDRRASLLEEWVLLDECLLVAMERVSQLVLQERRISVSYT